MKMKISDAIVAALLLVTVVVLMFFKGCSIDVLVALLFAAVLIAGVVAMIVQYRKIKVLEQAAFKKEK